MNANVNRCANGSRWEEVSAGELNAVCGGQYSTVLFDQNTMTGVIFFDDGHTLTMDHGKTVARTAPRPS